MTIPAALTLLLLAACPRPSAPVSIAPLPSDEPWYPLLGSELLPRYERPDHSASGRGLVWEQPSATCAARTVHDGRGRTTLVWAERPGGEARWRIQTRRWDGDGWIILTPPLFPDPIPDPANTLACPQLELIMDDLGRPVLGWVGPPVSGGASRSAWRLEGPLWRPMGLPGLAETLDGLAELPGGRIFLAAGGADGTEVLRWDGLDWSPVAPLPAGGRWQIAGDALGRLWAVGPAGGALQALSWTGEGWRSPAPLGSADAYRLGLDPDGLPAVLQVRGGALSLARAGADGGWRSQALPGVRLEGTLLALGFDGVGGPVVAEGLALPGRSLSDGVDRVRLHYWSDGALLASRTVEARLPAGDRPALFTTTGGAPALAWSGAPEVLSSVFARSWSGEDWGPMAPIADEGGGVSDSPLASDRPLLARDPRGGLLVLWVEIDPERGESLWLRRWGAEGWSEREPLTDWLIAAPCPDGPLATIRQVAVDFDRLGAPLISLRARRSCGAEGEWLVSRGRRGWSVSEAPFNPAPPAVEIRAWDLDGERTLRVKRAAGGQELPPLPVSPAFGEIDAALDDRGAPVVAWVGGTTGSLEIYAVRWDGASWSGFSGSATAGGVSNSEAPSRHPSVLAGADGVCVAWSEAGSGARQIVLRCHRPPSPEDEDHGD